MGSGRLAPAKGRLTRRFLTPVRLLPPPPASTTVLSSVHATEYTGNCTSSGKCDLVDAPRSAVSTLEVASAGIVGVERPL